VVLPPRRWPGTIRRVLTGFTSAATLVLGLLLVAAGALKIRHANAFAHAVQRLLPRKLPRRSAVARMAAPVVGSAELVIGAAFLAIGEVGRSWGPVVATAAAVLYVAFVGVILVAIRRGKSCGCFQSFSDGPAATAELARSLILAGLALEVAAAESDGPSSPWRAAAIPWALAILGSLVVVALGGSRGLQQAVWLVVGRITSRFSSIRFSSVHPIQDVERIEAVTAARVARSVQIFESWLGGRAAEIDWTRAVAFSALADMPAKRMRCITVTPPAGASITLTVSLPWEGEPGTDGVLVATVDGRPVSVMGGRLVEAAERRSS
jgi:hypothetical protein